METSLPAPDASTGSRPARRRRRRVLWWVLAVTVAGGVAAAVTPALLPEHRPPARPPAPGPQALARAAVTAGVPASLPGLAVLIAERERRVLERPRDGVSWALLGCAYAEQGRQTADVTLYPKAERALRRSLEVRPAANPQALEGLAALANARRDFPEAKKWAEEARHLAPRRWTVYPPLIDAYTGLGDYKAGRAALDRLMRLRKGPAVMARAAAVYRDRGWREDAQAQLSDAAAKARQPAERAAYLERAGQLAWERGEREDALRHFEAAVRLDPYQWAALAGQGRALAALGRTSEALTAYQVALAKQPSPQYALELGELYQSLGLTQAARVQYEVLRARVRQDAAGGVDGDLVLGRFEADHGSPRTAVDLLRAEWRRQPGIAVADALGWALHRAGDDEEALRFASVATDKAHGGGVLSPLYAYHRGMIERELEKYAPARRHLRDALRINPYFSPLAVPAARTALAALGEAPGLDAPVSVAGGRVR